MSFSYSFCTTIYNSVETVEKFIMPLMESGKDHEIIVVDNSSTDGTLEKLKSYGSIKTISQKCTRGKGRQIAVDSSTKDIVVMLDGDVEYLDIDGILDKFERSVRVDDLWHMYCRDESGLMPIVIAKKELINRMGGYPNLNAGEDTYMYLLAEKIGHYKKEVLPSGRFRGISIKGGISGDERRYNRTYLSIVLKRLTFTRDAIFVHEFGYRSLLKYYKLSGVKGSIIGLMEYIAGVILMHGLKEDTVYERYKKIMDL